MSFCNEDIQAQSEKQINDNVMVNLDIERLYLHSLLCRVLNNASRETFIIGGVLSIVLLLSWNTIDYCEEQIKQLCGDCITILSCLLGLTITGYSVILTLDKKVVKKLSETFSPHHAIASSKVLKYMDNWLHPSKSNAYNILCSSFVLCCMILLVTIILLVLFRNQPVPLTNSKIMFGIVKWFCIVSSISVFDVVFHLFAVSSYVKIISKVK